MNDLTLVAFAGAAIFAAANWFAVGSHNKTVEYIAKPMTMVALIVAATQIDASSPAQRWAFVIALAFSVCGDVFLMLPDDRFIQGVASFFLAHVAYIVGLRIGDTSLLGLMLGVAVVGAFVLTIGMRVRTAVARRQPEMVMPVNAYIAVISVMVACAVSTGEPLAIVGAGVFMLSDTLIAWNRFVQPLAWAPIAIMVTYHVGQALLVLSLASVRPV